MELSLALGYSRETIVESITALQARQFVITRVIGRKHEFTLSESGKRFMEDLKLNEPDKVEKWLTDAGLKNLDEFINLKDDIKKIEVNIRDIQENLEQKLVKTTNDINKFNNKLKQIDEKIDTFYGKIGEIMALVIAAISIIVFNINVMKSTEINFSYPLEAFLRLLVIDTPLLIIITVATILFNYIISKKIATNNLILFIVIIILLCFITIFVGERMMMI